MDKIVLLSRLADVRGRAEKAHLDVILNASEVAELEKSGLDASTAVIRLKTAINDEQKYLREMNWILDHLDRTSP